MDDLSELAGLNLKTIGFIRIRVNSCHFTGHLNFRASGY